MIESPSTDVPEEATGNQRLALLLAMADVRVLVVDTSLMNVSIYAAVAVLVLVLWAPVAVFEKPLGLLLLAALMVLGTEVLRRQAEAEFPDARLRARYSVPGSS